MTAVVRYQEPTPWVELLEPAHRLATSIAKTEFVPTALRNRPEAVMAAILAGNELGVSPMQALAKIHIVEGRPAPAAELMRAMAMARGHELWVEEATTTRCVICGRRAGSEHVTKITWTLDDAKRAGLAGKQVWQRYPRAMLLARASAELCRLVFPDVLGGMSYAKEEIEDGFIEGEVLDDQPTEIAAAAPQASPAPTRTRQRTRKAAPGRKAADAAPLEERPTPASTDEMPPLPGEDDAALAADATPSMPNDQLVAMRAREAGIKDHHQVVRAVTAGQKASAKDLDGDEVAQVLSALSGLGEGRLVLTLDEAGTPAVVHRDQDRDRPVTDVERQAITEALDGLTDEQKVAVGAAVKGFVHAVTGPAFTFRDSLVVADAIDRLVPAPAAAPADDDVAEPEAGYGTDEEPF